MITLLRVPGKIALLGCANIFVLITFFQVDKKAVEPFAKNTQRDTTDAIWHETSNYILSGIPEIIQDAEYFDSIITPTFQDKGNRLTAIKFETFFSSYCDTIEMISLNTRGFKNIKEVVRVRFVIPTCCSDLYDHYFLIGKKGDVTILPALHNTICDDPQMYQAYVFPTEKFGEKNKILLMEFTQDGYGRDDNKAAKLLKIM